MDGTLVDSTTGVKGAWNLFQETYPTIDVDYILNCKYLHLQYSATLFLGFFFLPRYSMPWRSHRRESQKSLWHPRSRDSQSEVLINRAIDDTTTLSLMAFPFQQEEERFEKAIITTSSAGGGQGIALLPGVRSIIDEVYSILAKRCFLF